MLYSTSLVLYTIFSFQLGRKPRVFLALGLAFLLSGLSWAHNFLGESSLHKLVFGSFIVCVFFRTQFLMRTKVTDQLALQKMRKLAAVGSVTFVSGYAFWLVDEIGCSQLRNARAYTGMPLGFFLELHGWYVSFIPPPKKKFYADLLSQKLQVAPTDGCRGVLFPCFRRVPPHPYKRSAG